MTAARIKTHIELEKYLAERRARRARLETPDASTNEAERAARDAAETADEAAALAAFTRPIGGEEDDGLWREIRSQAEELAAREPVLAGLLHTVILGHDRFEDALSSRIAQKLSSPEMSALLLRDLAADAMLQDPEIGAAARADVKAVLERDPACTSPLEPVIFLKGFNALLASRVAHWYWRAGRRELASALQMRISEAFGVDIHPGARIGRGVMIDHATGVVVGETAVIGDDVSMLHGVTLGGTGKETGDRHPKIGRGVLIGAGASILGNISVGECSRVGAGSVVLADVPHCSTVAGVPAKVVGSAGCEQPSMSMNHQI